MSLDFVSYISPVAVVVKFKDEDEVIEQANDSLYGLSSVVFTSDVSRALRVAHALEAGTTFVRTSSENKSNLIQS